MKRWFVFAAFLLFAATYFVWSAEQAKYPAPRFPSYLKPPKAIEEIMPYARAAVRQIGGRTPPGPGEKETGQM